MDPKSTWETNKTTNFKTIKKFFERNAGRDYLAKYEIELEDARNQKEVSEKKWKILTTGNKIFYPTIKEIF